MKRFLLISILFFLCGCSATYQLKIDGDKISEKLEFYVIPSQFKEEELSPDLSIYSKDSFDYIKNANIPAMNNNDSAFYEKEIIEDENSLQVHLKYDFKKDQFQNSRIINECFENHDIVIDKNKISIHLTGEFKCLNDSGDNIEFRIITNNKIESANIDYGILDKEYIWNIDTTNRNNVDIRIDMLKESKYKYYGIRIFAITFVVIALFGGLFLYAKISNRGNINKI